MADLRDMELLVALARVKHFSRAAEECGISQPAFSARIRNLEKTYDTAIVRRGNKFQGFTKDGEVLLKWAHRMLADRASLEQELSGAEGSLGGQLSLGCVPTALFFAAQVAGRLRRKHPDLLIDIRSMSSTAIRAGLQDYSLDAALIYADISLATDLTITPAYEESYLLAAPEDLAPRKSGAITWNEAAELPLALLSKDMRNRALIDRAFSSVGASPKIVMESNSFTASLVQVAEGIAATIVPRGLAEQVIATKNSVLLEMKNPALVHAVGLATNSTAATTQSVEALRETIARMS